MKLISRLATLLALALAVIPLGRVAVAQDYPPAVIFETMMDSFFGDTNGLVVFGNYDLAFAPEGPANAMVGLIDSNNNVLAQYDIFPDYRVREGVFARMMVQGPADVQLTEPGTYTMVFVFNNEPISRFPFLLRQTGDGEDPFDPEKTYAFDGYWRTLAHITMSTFKDEPIPIFSMWLGGLDMPAPDTFQEYFVANLLRDGALVAHSKNQTSFYSNGHFERREVTLYQPHDEQQAANAIPLTMNEMLVDGTYVLDVARASDGAKLRKFVFAVADGAIQPLPRTQLGFDPAVDYMVPRVTKKGSTMFEFVEAIWIGGEAVVE